MHPHLVEPGIYKIVNEETNTSLSLSTTDRRTVTDKEWHDKTNQLVRICHPGAFFSFLISNVQWTVGAPDINYNQTMQNYAFPQVFLAPSGMKDVILGEEVIGGKSFCWKIRNDERYDTDCWRIHMPTGSSDSVVGIALSDRRVSSLFANSVREERSG